MSIETLLGDIVEQLKINNKLLAQQAADRGAILDKAAKLEGKSDKAAKEDKPAAKTEKTEKPSAKGGKPKKLTEEDVRKAFGAYLSVEDKEERADRKAFVVEMLDHLKAEKATEIAEEDREQALQWLKDKEAGKKVSFSDDEADDEGDEEDEDDLV